MDEETKVLELIQALNRGDGLETKIKGLIRDLSSDDNYTRCMARFEFRDFGKSIVPVLITFLKYEIEKKRNPLTKNTDINRKNTVLALGITKDSSAIPILFDVLSDENEGVRKEAVKALVKIIYDYNKPEDLQEFEEKLSEFLLELRRNIRDIRLLKKIELDIAGLWIEIAEKKNQLMGEKDLLLTGIPKPPKRGKVFKQLGRVRNG